MGLKLLSHSLIRNLILKVVPVSAQSQVSWATKRFGLLGVPSLTDTLPIGGIFELLRLKIMFDSRPPLAIYSDTIRCEV